MLMIYMFSTPQWHNIAAHEIDTSIWFYWLPDELFLSIRTANRLVILLNHWEKHNQNRHSSWMCFTVRTWIVNPTGLLEVLPRKPELYAPAEISCSPRDNESRIVSYHYLVVYHISYYHLDQHIIEISIVLIKLSIPSNSYLIFTPLDSINEYSTLVWTLRCVCHYNCVQPVTAHTYWTCITLA